MKKTLFFGFIGIVLFTMAFLSLGYYNNSDAVTKILKPQYNLQVVDLTAKNINPNSAYKTLKLSDFKGKTVLLNFFATWCPPCRAEIPTIVKFFNTHYKNNFVVIGINMSQGEGQNIQSFIKEFGIKYPIVEGNVKIASNYSIMGLPTSFVIDPNGRLVATQIGEISETFLSNSLKK
jgi:thiol-disulfide isomerase/thioredoxin